MAGERARRGAPPAARPSGSSPSSTFSSTVSQGNRAKLWNTMAMDSVGPVSGRPRQRTSPADRAGQAGDDPQQAGLAGARAAQQADDLAGAQGQVDAVQHQEVVGGGLGVGLAQVLDLQQHLGRGLGLGRRAALGGGHRICSASAEAGGRRR